MNRMNVAASLLFGALIVPLAAPAAQAQSVFLACRNVCEYDTLYGYNLGYIISSRIPPSGAPICRTISSFTGRVIEGRVACHLPWRIGFGLPR